MEDLRRAVSAGASAASAQEAAGGDDAALVSRLLAGDEATFARLVEAYHPQFLRVARAFVASDAVAEEVVQETWSAILQGLSRFQRRSSLKTWMFRILTNRAKTRAVREGRQIPFSALEHGGESSNPEADLFKPNGTWATKMRPWQNEPKPEDATLNKELMRHVNQAVGDLPENQRVVITLRDIQGWSSEDVCNFLEISETNQRVLLHRARTKVRRYLSTYLTRE